MKDAEERGQLRPGGVIVEGTAGNTGIGLALVGNAKGYRTVIVIPDTQSEEKKDMLRLCGADLRQVPAVPYKNPENYVHVSRRLAEELAEQEPNGAIWANQFDNEANWKGHYETTGPEIWEQTDGKVDAFICAVGTGGTLHGRLELPQGAEPRRGDRARRSRGRRDLRLLQGRRAQERGQLDHRGHRPGPHHEEHRRHGDRRALPHPDKEWLPVAYDLLQHDGLCVGGLGGASTSRARSGSPASSGPARRS